MKANSTPQDQETYIVSDGKLANVFVYVKDGLGNYSYDPPTDVGEDRPEGLPLSPARVRHAGRPAARDRQQRSDAPQHPRAAEGQRGVQQRPAHPGHEDDAHVHGEGSHGAVQVRRPRLDERLRRRRQSPVLRGDRQGRQVHLKGLPPGTYTIEAWHEKLGTQTQTVTIAREGNEGRRTSRSRPPRPRTDQARQAGRAWRVGK